MVNYRYVGRGVTNEYGVATLQYDANNQPVNGYVGVGAGELDFIASLDNPIQSGSFVSKTFVVYDTLQHYFESPTSSELSVLDSNMSLSVDNGYVLAEQTSGTTGYVGVQLNSNVSDYKGKTVRFEMNAEQNVNRAYFIRVYIKTSSQTTWTRVASQILDSSLIDLPYAYIDTELPSDLTSVWFRIDANTQNENNIHFKDWKVYLI